VSNNPKLKTLECRFNQLSILDVSNNTALTELDCENNQLGELALDKIFRDLPDWSEESANVEEIEEDDEDVKYIFIENNLGSSTCDRSIATAKKWVFSYDEQFDETTIA
jgi:Leucine-rich repeat (LRR) protein